MVISKIVLNNTTQIDLTDTTAVASDVASGKYFYGADGVKTAGTASTSSAELGTKTITTNGAYDATDIKQNGAWVEQSDVTQVFQSGVNYRQG